MTAFALLAFASAAGCARAPVDRVEWLVMGTVAAVQTRGAVCETNGQAHVVKVMEVFKDVETRLNAHSPTSELSRLAFLPNGCPGRSTCFRPISTICSVASASWRPAAESRR